MDFRLLRRAKQNYFYWLLFRLVESVAFNFTIYLLIVANTCLLAMERYDLSDDEIALISACNLFFTIAFFIEMILKFVGLGVKNYMMDGYNVFDCVIVIISLVDLVLEQVAGVDQLDILKVFRALRLLRTIKIAR